MNSQAKNVASTATVSNSIASGYISTSLVNSSTASGIDIERTCAYGYNSIASGNISTYIGKNSVASGDYSTAGGGNSYALGAAATSYVVDSLAVNDFITAVGGNIMAIYDYSVSLGAESFTDDVVSTDKLVISGNTFPVAGGVAKATVSIGTNVAREDGGIIYRTLTNLAAGQITEDSNDAVNGSQMNIVIKVIEAINARLTKAGIN